MRLVNMLNTISCRKTLTAVAIVFFAQFLPIARAQQAVFTSDFGSSGTLQQEWSQTTNGGAIGVSEGVLHVSGTGNGYPVLYTNRDPFPSTGDWTARFIYRYTSIGHYGTSISCLLPNGEQLARVHQDVNGQFYQANGKNIAIMSANTNRHVLTIARSGRRIIMTLDGERIGDSEVTVEPVGIKIGGGFFADASDWSNLDIYSLHVLEASSSTNAYPTVTSARRPAFISVHVDDKSICCLPGDTLRLDGQFKSADDLQTAFLDTGNNWTQKRSLTGKSDNYSYDWTAPKAGVYQLDASYTLNDDRRVDARHLTVNVLPSAPLTIDVPPSAVSDVTVSAKQNDQVQFHSSDIFYYFDGRRISTVAGQSLEVKLPIGSLSTGGYPFYYEAVDQSLGRFVGGTSTITVPERVQVALLPAVQLATPNDKVFFGVRLAPGVTVAKVVYSCGGQQVAVSDNAPFTTSAPLSSFKSGTYDVQAVATDSEGKTLASPKFSVALTNQPDDKARASAAKIAAEQKAKEDQRQAQIAQQKAERQARLAKEEAERPAREAAAKQAERNNAAVAMKSHAVTFSISGDLWKIGGEYYVDIVVTNRSPNAIRLMPPDLVLDDYSSEGLFPINPAEKDGIEIVTPAQSTVTHGFKSLGLSTSKIGKSLKIRINTLLNGNNAYAFVPLSP